MPYRIVKYLNITTGKQKFLLDISYQKRSSIWSNIVDLGVPPLILSLGMFLSLFCFNLKKEKNSFIQLIQKRKIIPFLHLPCL